MLEVDPQLLAERARLGLDRRDEMWDGELHMVPPPATGHQAFASRLLRAIGPLADERGLEITQEVGYFGHEFDYRVPDLAVFDRDRASDARLRHVSLVVEIRSPRDESMVKVPWYLARGCREVLIVDRDTLALQLHTAAGVVKSRRSQVLGCTFTTIDGPAVQLSWHGGSTIVTRP
ncbi:hypothetical protein BH18ACT2_BH18ACT2_00820 [soil metagenome]